MNTSAFYRRDGDRDFPEPVIEVEHNEAANALAVHRDPSVPGTEPSGATGSPRPRVSWIRPTEMPTLLGSTYVRRGIDLQAELSRRARRTPGAAVASASRRLNRSTDPWPQTSASTVGHEGVGL